MFVPLVVYGYLSRSFSRYRGDVYMTELAELSRIVDALEETISEQKTPDVSCDEKRIQEIGSIIQKLGSVMGRLAEIQARICLQRAIRSKWNLKRLEREHILSVLAGCSGNRAKAEKRLGIGRGTLWRKLKEFSADEG